MATIQRRYKWMAVFLSALAAVVQLASGCHPSSKALHICINIYLERDFSLIETIINGLQRGDRFSRGKVILEGPDLFNICKHIAKLRECYWNLLPQCDTLWQYDRFMRVMDLFDATINHLCLNGTDKVRDLLLNSGCLSSARSHVINCTGFDWAMTWRKVLRMQVSPQDLCTQLESYGNCLNSRSLDEMCGPNAKEIYLNLIDLWLRHWCAKDLTPDEERRYFYLSLTKT